MITIQFPKTFVQLLVLCAKEFFPIAFLLGCFGLAIGFITYLGFGSAGIHFAMFASAFGVLIAFVRMMCVVFNP